MPRLYRKEYGEAVIMIHWIGFFVMACFAFWINHSWYKHCNKMNEDWYKCCNKINEDWSAICKKLIEEEENESKN